MNFNIYIEDELGRKIDFIADISGQKRNNIIREAITQWVMEHYPADWPTSIKNFSGIKDFPAFESYRGELSTPKEDLF